METVTDWVKLWRELVSMKIGMSDRKNAMQLEDYWRKKADRFKSKKGKKQSDPGSSLTFIASILKSNPDSTLLDIGAGAGDWSEFLAPYAKKVTALEPSDFMGELISEKIIEGNIENVELVKGSWPAIDIEPHDYTLASHSMYTETEFQPFIDKMVETSRKGCFLVLKTLFLDTVMAKASQRILGQPYDSPCLQIAFNALHQMGIYPNVEMESGKSWNPWSNDSLDDALLDIKRRFGILNTSDHDDFLTSLLESELIKEDGKYIWPEGVGSALVYWDV